MLRTIFSIAQLHVKLVLSNRSVFFFSLLLPIIFTAFMAQANVTGFGSSGTTRLRLYISNEDKGKLGQNLVAALQQSGEHWQVSLSAREESLSQVKSNQANMALIIPNNFTEAAFNSQRAELEFFGAASDAASQAQLAEQAVKTIIARTNTAVAAAEASTREAEKLGLFKDDSAAGTAAQQRRAYLEAGYDRAASLLDQSTRPLIQTESRMTAASINSVNGGANQSSPGVIVIFALLFAVSGTNVLIWERQAGTLRRLVVTPAGKAKILSGKLLGIYFIGLVQISLLILAGAFLFKVAWGNSPLALVLLVLGFTLVATSMGILLATLVKTVAQADALASMVVMSISALGGAWWPLSATPVWMRFVGHLFPTAWAMDGFQAIIVGGQSVAGVLPEIGMLFGFAALFLTVSVLRFRYQ
jgi:ABC-2 type transport system permease protein